MKNMKNVARIGMLPVAGAALFACAPLFGDDRDWQPSPGTHAIEADLQPSVGYYESAVNAINGRHYALALDYLQAARAAKADDVRVLTAFGVVYDKLGRFDLSARYYSQATALEPKSAIIAQDVDYSHRLQVLVQGPAVLVANAAPSLAGEGAWHPALASGREMPFLPPVDGDAVMAINIPNIGSEIVVGETKSLQAPTLMVANAAHSDVSEVTLRPTLVAEREMPAFPLMVGDMVTAVNIPKIGSEIIAGDLKSPQTPTHLVINATLSDAGKGTLRPTLVAEREMPSLPPMRGDMVTAVNIPKVGAEVVGGDTKSQAPTLLATNATLSDAGKVTLRPTRISEREMPALPLMRRDMVTAVNIPKIGSEIVAGDTKSFHAPTALVAIVTSSQAGQGTMRSTPRPERPVPAVPAVGHVAAAGKLPKMAPKIIVVDARTAQAANARAWVGGRSVILTGHPLVLVNASGHSNTPVSIGHRLSGLGWTVAKSVQAAPQVQAKTTIIYEKTKSAAAMALARTLSLSAGLIASKDAIGLRLVLGSDLSGSLLKGQLSHVPGKRMRLADTRYESRE